VVYSGSHEHSSSDNIDILFRHILKHQMDSILDRRSEQLQRESLIDGKLQQLNCPLVVNQLLFSLREVNREQMQKIHSDGIFSLYSNTKKNLDCHDESQKKLLTILSSEDPCSELQSYLK